MATKSGIKNFAVLTRDKTDYDMQHLIRASSLEGARAALASYYGREDWHRASLVTHPRSHDIYGSVVEVSRAVADGIRYLSACCLVIGEDGRLLKVTDGCEGVRW